MKSNLVRDKKMTYAETDIVYCYWLKTVQFVPHYVKEGVYVAPGGIYRTEEWLRENNAKRAIDQLWPRHWMK